MALFWWKVVMHFWRKLNFWGVGPPPPWPPSHPPWQFSPVCLQSPCVHWSTHYNALISDTRPRYLRLLPLVKNQSCLATPSWNHWQGWDWYHHGNHWMRLHSQFSQALPYSQALSCFSQFRINATSVFSPKLIVTYSCFNQGAPGGHILLKQPDVGNFITQGCFSAVFRLLSS